ncbi:MAG: type II toxin-antitoxin system mRNA interferase toxin, RelE/StbE family [Spirochaetia bacterium]
MSNRYSIAETAAFQKTLQKNKNLSSLYQKIRAVAYPALRREPHFGPNIKRLKGEFSDFYRYRIGDYRLFYAIEESEVIVVVADLRSRQGAYNKK